MTQLTGAFTHHNDVAALARRGKTENSGRRSEPVVQNLKEALLIMRGVIRRDHGHSFGRPGRISSALVRQSCGRMTAGDPNGLVRI